MNKHNFFTRKNFLVWSFSFFYAFLLIFVGACLDGSHTFVLEGNPIENIGHGLHFKSINCGLSGYIALILVAIYVIACVGFIIYERRVALLNQKNPHNYKMVLIYLGTVVACIILSLGVGILIQSPLTKKNIGMVLRFIGQTVLLTTLLYIALAIFVSACLMLLINFINIDKPFRFFNAKDLSEFDEPTTKQEEKTAATNSNSLSSSFEGVKNVEETTTPSIVSGETTSQAKDSEPKEEEIIKDREKVFPTLSMIDQKYSGFEITDFETDDYSLEEICNKFRNYLAKVEKLYFDIDTIRFFVSGFATSHLMILEGLSGTGKSSLPRYFAKFINAKVCFIPVQATWRDKTSILGYFNDFSKTYSETDFLIALYESNFNPEQINLFVLDEMNISRVEYYFADFLSVLEYPTESWKLRVMQLPYQFIPPMKLENGYVSILPNSYFIGTANKDDSTFSITDKVYDRAITIDFETRSEPFEIDEEVSTIQLSSSKFHQLLSEGSTTEEFKLTKEDYQNFKDITDYIYKEFDITFGNRILNQIQIFVPTFVACGGKKEDALDFLLSRKILVKLEGRFEEYIKTGLKRLLTLLDKTYGAGTFVRSEQAIQNLIRKL